MKVKSIKCKSNFYNVTILLLKSSHILHSHLWPDFVNSSSKKLHKNHNHQQPKIQPTTTPKTPLRSSRQRLIDRNFDSLVPGGPLYISLPSFPHSSPPKYLVYPLLLSPSLSLDRNISSKKTLRHKRGRDHPKPNSVIIVPSPSLSRVTFRARPEIFGPGLLSEDVRAGG